MERRKNKSKHLGKLPNIGLTIGKKLAAIGIRNTADLKKMGAAHAYEKLCQQERKVLPVCYYLYSLEAALKGCKWQELSIVQKKRLLRSVGIG